VKLDPADLAGVGGLPPSHPAIDGSWLSNQLSTTEVSR
jgi:hypothetical protein